jgi:hypothetical protein
VSVFDMVLPPNWDIPVARSVYSTTRAEYSRGG